MNTRVIKIKKDQEKAVQEAKSEKRYGMFEESRSKGKPALKHYDVVIEEKKKTSCSIL